MAQTPQASLSPPARAGLASSVPSSAWLAALLVVLAAACAPPALLPQDPNVMDLPSGSPPLVRVGDPPGLRVASTALDVLDHDRRLVRRDCSGLVETVYGSVGIELPEADDMGLHSSVASEYHGLALEHALYLDHPLPGDLAFFSDTWDRNHNGRRDDPLTHVAIVVSQDLDGTLTLVHFGGHGLATFRMNLWVLHQSHDRSGKRVNDVLRPRRRRERAHTPHLASELFVAFGRAADRRPSYASRR